MPSLYDIPTKFSERGEPFIFSKVIRTLRTVVLPDPDGPIIETISDEAVSNDLRQKLESFLKDWLNHQHIEPELI